MDAQELRNLQEAYMEVYQELDEAKSDEGLSRDEKEQVRAERQGGRDRISRGMRNDVMRGKKREKGVKSSYDSLGNMNRTRYRQQQFKRTGNPLYSEEFDLYDIILSHLLDEGYAKTPEAAEAIMVNMSEEWREDIIEARQEEGLPDKQKRRIRRSRLPYDGGKGKRAETVRQEWHKDQRGKRGESPLASNPRYENEPGRRIRGQGYVRYSDDDN